jgi:hypothetical protein
MPRSNSQTPQDVRPFSPDAPDASQFAALPAAEQSKVAASIAADKASGLSGDELRSKYGPRLTGPARRKVLRAAGFDGAGYIARSYSQYRDGDDRNGTRHAREHGALALQRRRLACEEQAASADLRTIRADLREAGLQVPRGEQKLRAAYCELLLAAASAMPA